MSSVPSVAPGGVTTVTQTVTGPTATAAATGWNYVDAAKPYQGTKLELALLSGEYLEKAAQEKKSEWAPTGIDYELGVFGLTDLDSKIQSTFRAGLSTYDIAHIVPFDTVRFADNLERLEPYLENAAITDPQLNLWDFTCQDFSGYWNFDTSKPEMPGTIIGINYHAGGQGVVYRKDLLQQAGLDVPKTWDDYLAAAKATTNKDKGVYGTAVVAKVDASLAIMEWYARFASIGGNLFDGNVVDKNVHFNLDSAQSIEAANRIYELLPYAPAGTTSYGFTECMDAFRTGKVAMITIWTGVAANLFSPDLSPFANVTDLAPVPGEGEYRGVANKGGGHLSIPQFSKNKEAAWLWIQWYASKAMCKYRLLKGYTGVVRYSLLNDPDVLQQMPYVKQLGDILKKAKYMPSYAVPESAEIQDIIDTNLNAAFTGQIKVEDACIKANNEANAAMKRDGVGG
jgi:multiple sugar transport system substrate-binding protein